MDSSNRHTDPETAQYVNQYGMDWDPGTTEVSIELSCYRHNAYYEAEGAKVMHPFDHFVKAAQLLFPAPHMIWNQWTELHAWSFVNDNFAIFWGPAAAGKTNDFGCFIVTDWWADPMNTYSAVCSTTKPMLEKRVWESIERYHQIHAKSKGAPGVYRKSKFNITLDGQDNEDGSKKAGIHGFAVQDGSAKEAEANIVGVHLPRIRLLIDEMQSTRRAAVDARHNLRKGCEDFKFFGLCNPSSFLNIAGEHSEPVDGWESISVDTEAWKIKEGMCYHQDGLKSPAVLEENGAKKYPFLINQEQIDEDIKAFGEDSPHYWQYVRGFPPPSGEVNTVLNEKSAILGGVFNTVTGWRETPQRAATLDPSFGGEDKCKCTVYDLSYSLEGVYTAQKLYDEDIKIKASSDLPPTYQIARRVKEIGHTYNFKAEWLVVDESVTQTVGEVIDMEWEKGCIKIDFGSKAPITPMSIDNAKCCSEEYFNMISYLHGQFAKFISYGQMKNLTKKMIRQLCARIVLPGKPYRIEPKADYKSRMGYSPDEGDSGVMLVEILRKRLGVIPGAMQATASQGGLPDSIAQHLDIDGDASNYLNGSV